MVPLLLALAWLLVPEPLWAWGPGTHVALGELVLGSLYLLPPAVRELLARYPIHFLYGNVAADISFAKKYVPEGRHCHHWHVGEEIHQEAQHESEPLQATAKPASAPTMARNRRIVRRSVWECIYAFLRWDYPVQVLGSTALGR